MNGVFSTTPGNEARSVTSSQDDWYLICIAVSKHRCNHVHWYNVGAHLQVFHVCSHSSSTSATLWTICKNSSALDFSDVEPPIPSGYNELTNTSSGVMISNKSSSQMNPTTIWIITMAMYPSDVTETNAFSRNVSSSIILNERLALWGTIRYHTDIIRPTPNSKDSKQSAQHQRICETWLLLLLQHLQWAKFQQDNTLVHAFLNVQAFFRAHDLLLPWPISFLDMSLIEHV